MQQDEECGTGLQRKRTPEAVRDEAKEGQVPAEVVDSTSSTLGPQIRVSEVQPGASDEKEPLIMSVCGNDEASAAAELSFAGITFPAPDMEHSRQCQSGCDDDDGWAIFEISSPAKSQKEEPAASLCLPLNIEHSGTGGPCPDEWEALFGPPQHPSQMSASHPPQQNAELITTEDVTQLAATDTAKEPFVSLALTQQSPEANRGHSHNPFDDTESLVDDASERNERTQQLQHGDMPAAGEGEGHH